MVFCTACGKENDDKAKYCFKWGHVLIRETKEAVDSAAVHLDTDEKNPEKENWIKNIVKFIIIWGLVNSLIHYPNSFGLLFVIAAVLIYVFKSFEVICYWGVVWFLLGGLQVIVGIDHINNITTSGLGYIWIILGCINFVLGVGVIFYNKKIVVSTSN